MPTQSMPTGTDVTYREAVPGLSHEQLRILQTKHRRWSSSFRAILRVITIPAGGSQISLTSAKAL